MDRFTCPARRGLFLAFEGMFLGLRTEIKLKTSLSRWLGTGKHICKLAVRPSDSQKIVVAVPFTTAAEKLGIKVSGQYWTLGAFDGVLVFEAPDHETATAALLHLGSLGNLRTQTARAFDAAEMQKILGLLPK
jgi:uncharacterized protein with GYD domain